MHASEQVPPQAVMMQLINGKLVSRCVSIAAELSIADRLRDGPKDAATLAEETGTDADALYRMLRMLAGLGVFVELPAGRFRQSPLSEVLCGDAPGSVRDYARWLGTELHWRVVTDLDRAVRTGRPVVDTSVPDQPPFDVLAGDRIAQKVFNDAMTGLSAADGSAIVDVYDFPAFSRIIDVAGGHGALAALIAQAAPESEVTLFDQPQVIHEAEHILPLRFPEARVRTAAGNFLEEVPGPVDVCILKHIIHDWDDHHAWRILTQCRKALGPEGRLLVCELLITPGPESMAAKILDIEMLAGSGGKERTEVEFEDLLRASGLRLQRVIETRTPVCVLEAVAA